MNICLSMRRSFIAPDETYKTKIASAVFFILKKTYLQEESVIFCSIGGSVLFVFADGIMTSPSQSSLMLCR